MNAFLNMEFIQFCKAEPLLIFYGIVFCILCGYGHFITLKYIANKLAYKLNVSYLISSIITCGLALICYYYFDLVVIILIGVLALLIKQRIYVQENFPSHYW
ncbi:MAG: hypothetical protein JSR17_10025 [Proteobacteria bacterium]|nr:hypothetical protein [Pseudomonadota bacterium]